LISVLAKSLKRANRRALTELAGIYETLGETLGSMKIIKAFTMESQQRRRFHTSAKEYYRKSMKIAKYDSLVSPVTEIMGMGMIVLAILAGGYLSIERQTHLFGFLKISDRPLDKGDLMLFFAMLAGVSDPARRLSNVFGQLQRAAAASDRVFEMLDREPKIADPVRPRLLPVLSRALYFDGVSFAYDTKNAVLSDIDLSIAAGETIALVGPNGCGKSTLAGLVTRFYDPDVGRVTIDGVDLRDVRLRDLRQRIGVVTQEALLLNDTVAENIRYAKPAATDEEVIAAAKQAHAHRFIETKLADGYATLVGPGGGRLSGGQRQRIALARAILRDPEILILDEATSQIDVESERLIHEVLADFTRHRTTILITHRTSTLALADQIVVLDKGRILDSGTREQLLARCDLFRRLCHTGLRESA
jgi:ATP-binding cassette subfamily B protein/subfamily B ATP-binding cassette protein MsbA